MKTPTTTWPLTFELDSWVSVDAVQFGIDVNAEKGEAVGFRSLRGRFIRLDSHYDAHDCANYIHREALLESSPKDRREMFEDARRLIREADRIGE